MSVRSRGRYVPRPAPLTARKLRSPQDLNRRRPLARPISTGPPRRSMFASTTRPVRHSTPLPLSIVARPHEAGLIRSWRADSLAFVWLDPGITPCCKRPKTPRGKFSAKERNKRQSPVNAASGPLSESPVSLEPDSVVPHVIIRSSRLWLQEFESRAAKRLLQHYRHFSDMAR